MGSGSWHVQFAVGLRALEEIVRREIEKHCFSAVSFSFGEFLFYTLGKSVCWSFKWYEIREEQSRPVRLPVGNKGVALNVKDCNSELWKRKRTSGRQ